MKKIYWFLRQTNHLAGTEMVTLDIINKLSKFRDITLVVMASENKDINFNISNRVDIKYFNIPYKIACIDEHLAKTKGFRKIIDSISGSLFWINKRFKYRKIVKEMTTKNDILIFSSFDNYLFAPKGRRCLFHFHFNAKFFRNPGIAMGRMFHRRPDKYIFLTEATKKIIEKKTKYKDNYQVHNPIRFMQYYNTDFKNKEIIFIGRYTNQKDPLLALKVMKAIKDKNFKCHLSMFGSGDLLSKMEKFIKKNQLESYVTINSPTKDIINEIRKSDLLLSTSKFEGLPLTIVEANSQSVPIVSSNWGDAVYEVINDEISGYVIEKRNPELFADKIIEILSKPKLLEKLKKNAFNHSYTFSDDVIVSKWLDILQNEDNANSK